MYNTKNYTEQGGEKTVIGGEIVIEGKITVAGGGKVEGITWVTAAESTIGGIKAAAKGEGYTVEAKIDSNTSKLYVPTYPTVPGKATIGTAGIVNMATNVAKITGEGTVTKEKFNGLIDALVAAGLMASEEE